MIFSSWHFICIFLPIAILGFDSIPARYPVWRKVWLIIASLCFYAYWKVEYLPLITFSIVINYITSDLIYRHHATKKSHLILVLGIITNLSLLGYFKYADFFISTLNQIVNSEISFLNLILPLAISFFTFTQIAYLVDVYRDKERHYNLIDYCLFVVFFPHLIAGPIVRHWEIIPQYSPLINKLSIDDFTTGVSIFLIGLYKKILLADPMAGIADPVFGAALQGVNLTFLDSWVGAIAYTLQIYFDFSGYSDMAIGLARMFSIRFPCNFNSPYKAESIAEFWKRWHITLTRFLREYLYFPLGGNRLGPFRQGLNVMIVFLSSGLWHGAGWTFIAWGSVHGLLIIAHNALGKIRTTFNFMNSSLIYKAICVSITFLSVLYGWVLFRSSNFNQAYSIFKSMTLVNGFTIPVDIAEANLGLGRLFQMLGASVVPSVQRIPGLSYNWTLHGILCLLVIAWFFPNTQELLADKKPTLENVLNHSRKQIKFSFGYGLVMGMPLLLIIRNFIAAQSSPFLYFNF